MAIPTGLWAQSIRYVKATASGSGNGSSWDHASANLKAMMDTASGNVQIWVAAGTYYPTTSTDRSASFIMRNNVAVFGGFNGTENTLAERGISATILSGDIGVANDTADNSYHVVRTANEQVNQTAVLDGVRITKGNASGQATDGFGGGFYSLGASPVLRGVSMEFNSSSFRGGGLFVSGGALVLDSCTLFGNYTQSQGGGAVIENCTATVDRCLFQSNEAGSNSGALIITGTGICQVSRTQFIQNKSRLAGAYTVNTASTFSRCFTILNSTTVQGGSIIDLFGAPVFEQCVFYNNQLAMDGNFINANNSTARLVQSTFVRNGLLATNATVLAASNGSNLTVTNCLFNSNAPFTFKSDGMFSQAAFQITYSCNTSSITGPTNIQGNISFRDPFSAQGPDNRLGTADDGLVPLACGLPQDIGSDAAAPWETDIAGQPRKVKCKPFEQTVDAGAYEIQAACTPTGNRLYVQASRTLTNLSGESWQNAFKNLDEALAWAQQYPSITEIWVAAGTYLPTRGTNRHAAFPLRNNLAIYGGFQGFETNLDQRDVAFRQTILSGNIGDAASRNDNSFHVVVSPAGGLSQTSVLDGFIIREGQANSNNSDGGGGMRLSSGSPAIRNCVFDQNYGVAGGAVYIGHGAPVFTNCVFTGNNASVGGAIHTQGAGQVQVLQGVFSGNSAISGGVLVANESGGVSFVNCTIANNSASFNGVCYTYIASASFTNCLIWGNSSFAGEDEGGATYVNHSLLNFSYPGANNVVGKPEFFDETDADGMDNRWYTLDDGLRLKRCSQAANRGNNDAISLTTDLAKQNRKFGVVDAGAYEVQELTPSTIFVWAGGGDGNEDGSSWTDAYQNLSPALTDWANCPSADTLALAAGTYIAPSGNFTISKPGGILLGNFIPATGLRDPALPTILRGRVTITHAMRLEGIEVQPKQ